MEAFVVEAAEAFRLEGPVYHFGPCPDNSAYDVGPLNGCFPTSDYLVCQFDEEIQFSRMPFPNGAARTVLWLGTLGQAFDTEQAVAEAQRILAPGGAFLICAPVEKPNSQGTATWWQAEARNVHRVLAPLRLTFLGWQGAEGAPHTVYGLGFKPPIREAVFHATDRFLERFTQRLEAACTRFGWWRRLKTVLGFRNSQRRESSGQPVESRVQFAIHMSAGGDLDAGLLKAWLPDEKTGGRLDLMD